MAWLKNTFVWIMVAVIVFALAHAVVKRPKPHVSAPPAVVEVAPLPKPAPVHVPPVAKPEPPKAAVEAKPRNKHTESRVKRAQEKRERNRVTVKPESGAHAVSVPCPTLKGYVDKFGRARVVSGAQYYGYTDRDAEHALNACGL